MATINGTPYSDNWLFPAFSPPPEPTSKPVINGTAESDDIFADAGNDYVFAGNGHDVVDGWTGNDMLRGEAGNDTLWGYAGDDALYGEEGADVLLGEADNDYLAGGAGDDWLVGGSGADKFAFYSPGQGIDIVDDFNYLEGDKIVVATAGDSGNYAFGQLGPNDYDRFSYDFSTGALSFDGTQFALLPTGLDFIASEDIVFQPIPA